MHKDPVSYKLRTLLKPFYYYYEDGWESRWVKSSWKKSEGAAGDWIHTPGKWHGDPEDKGAGFIILWFHVDCFLIQNVNKGETRNYP